MYISNTPVAHRAKMSQGRFTETGSVSGAGTFGNQAVAGPQ